MDYPFQTAYPIAHDLARRLDAACIQLDIAGSLRRKSQVVHDIEIVCQPNLEPVDTLFGSGELAPGLLDQTLDMLLDTGVLLPGRVSGPRYRQFRVPPSGIALDLFVVLPPAQYGSLLAIRTGPAHYSKWLVTQRRAGGAMPSHYRHRDGGLYDGDHLVETPTEAAFFAALGITTVPDPQDRHPRWSRV